ncbi:serine threonine kinase [Fusarium subglutinans]|uniref:Serine threonine kinase n=1 Tax=Gibberella subglutinans TaxID=42677 RepID=A0A8H5PC46_GIBSU|nr:serine threonine kinase [Fusarium subglutinans]KAF5593781.1 serine threonine kinase [Fusarium subglutinans]
MVLDVQPQNDDRATGSHRDIRAVASECQNLFGNEVMDSITLSTHIRRAEHRFLSWVSFLGVHADKQHCLDTRLRHSPETMNLILLMLQVLRRNLQLVVSEHQHIRTDHQKGPIYGIDGALDRLHRLAAVIQSQQTLDEAQDINKIMIKRVLDGFDESIIDFIQKKFPNAPFTSSLLDIPRYKDPKEFSGVFGILFKEPSDRIKQHIHKKRKQNRQKNYFGNLPSPSVGADIRSSRNLEVESGSNDPSGIRAAKSPVNPCHVSQRFLNEKATEVYANTDQGDTSADCETFRSLHPCPDRLISEDGTEEVYCVLCSNLLNKATIESQEAWMKHVDHDSYGKADNPIVCENQKEVEDFYEHFTGHLRFIAFEGLNLWDTHTGAKMNHFAPVDCPSTEDDKRPEQDEDYGLDSLMDSRVKHFHDYVKSKSLVGLDGEEKVVPYIPPCELEAYWTVERINYILAFATIPIDTAYEAISHGYLKIFSILVFIGHCDKMSVLFPNRKVLDDHNLPFTADDFEPKSKWSDEFLEAQWMFCPFIFSRTRVYKRPLHPRTILPVTYDDCIKERRVGPDAVVLRKVRIHDHCKSMVQKSQFVVFKMYEGINAEERYSSETAIYEKLHDKSNDSIVRHIASFHFQHNHKFVIVLEYAAHGSLLDYLQKTPQPITPDDFALFWGRLIQLLDALHTLSDIYRQSHSLHESLAGVHQDIHPGNILVFPGTDSKSSFNVHFKITDFGLGEMGRISGLNDALASSSTGNRMYISPEAFANFAVQDRVRTVISPATDIWSLGAVFSDVLIWTIAGEAGRERYRRSRFEEIAELPHLSGAGYDCCFHDGEQRLKAVRKVHGDFLLHRRSSDSISPFISKLILRNMLIGQLGRLNAMQIRLRAEEGLQKILAPEPSKNGMSFVPTPDDKASHQPRDSFSRPPIERRATAAFSASRQGAIPNLARIEAPANQAWSMISMQGSISQPPTDQSIRYTQTGDRLLTVGEIYQMIEAKDKDSRRGSFRRKSSKRDEILDLPGIQESRSKIRETKGREHIFIIDNFTSMEPYMEKVKKTARAVSYVTKLANHNGMEVFAASETTMSPKTCKHSVQVEKAIGNFKTVRGTCRMRKCLDDILNRILVERPFKPTSIYIFTDGVWEQGEDQVEFAVNRATQYLIKHGLPSSSIMFQFIQFGRNAEGTARMKRLDDHCKKETDAEKFDIVDHKHWDAHVPDIVIGSLSPYTDEVEHRRRLIPAQVAYELSTVPRPFIIADNQVLIKVHAASINPVDVKKAAGIFKMAVKEEFPYQIGYDAAGVIVEVGKRVTALEVGDEVYTRLPEIGRGAWSEYVKCTDAYVSLKPESLSFVDAASLPLAGVTALQVLGQYKGSLEGKTVLIPGGLSGTGALACQLAKNVFHAAKVITTVSTSKIPKVPELLGEGTVDQIIDYTNQKVAEAVPPKSVDFCFDTTGQAMEFLSLMVPSTGMIVSISTTPSASTLQASSVMRRPENPQIPFAGRLFLHAADAIRRLRAWRWGVTYMYHFLDPNREDLHKLTDYVDDGKVKPVVRARVDMRDIEAVREACDQTYKGKGGLGKTVFEVIKD